MLVEEFKRCINSDIKSFLDEKQFETLEAAARLADDYALTHKASFVNKPIPRKTFSPQLGPKSNPSNPSGNFIIHLLQSPNLLVKTKVKIPYLRLFVIIISNQVM